MTPSPQTATHRGVDGAAIAVESTSSTPGVLFIHANGFCKELWRPVAGRSAVATSSGWVAIDQRGHGDSEVGAPPYLWDTVARDVVAILDPLGRPPIGVGHSSGGAALARAEILAPGSFDRLVLIEPILPPPPFERRDIPLASGAERRRSTFPDRDAARQRFADGPFGRWTAEELDLYVDHGFRATDDGWTLKCAPEVEADYYREGYNVDTWDRLGEIGSAVTIIVGADSDSHQEPYLSQLVDRFHDADLIVLDGVGHLAPMEQPAAVAEAIDRAAGGGIDEASAG